MSAYTSLAAFLAHWRALKRENPKGGPEAARLAEMDGTIAEVLGTDAALLAKEDPGASDWRHRQRAESKLRRELLARGIVTG